MLVGVVKTLGLAFFLRKGLDHTDAGDGVCQDVGHLAPHAINLLEARAQPVAHGVNHPADERQRHQRDQRQPRVDREKDRRRHENHQHVGDEVERMQREEHVDAIGLGADARHQIAGSLAAKVIER